MIIAIMAAVLAGGGTYLVLQRGMLRTIIGMTLISLSLIHISEPTRRTERSRMPSSA